MLKAGIPIWVSPTCAEFRGVTAEEIDEVGARLRDMAEMLREVADGAQLVPYVG